MKDLVACRDCERSISRTAVVCPECGAFLRPLAVFGLGIALLFVGIYASRALAVVDAIWQAK